MKPATTSETPLGAGHGPIASHRPLTPLVYIGATVYTAALLLALRLFTEATLFAESGPAELTQALLWGTSAVFALVFCWRIPDDGRGAHAPEPDDESIPKDGAARWFTAWLGVMATLALLRELDMHVYANPETLGEWGVRYRLDWWVDPAAPGLPKLLWAGVFLVIGSAVVYPIVRAWPTLLRALLRRRLVLLMGAVSGLGLFVGWASDDLLREWTKQMSGPWIEEMAELIGAWAYLVAVGLLLWRR